MGRKKSDGPLLQWVADLRVFATRMVIRDQIELKERFMDQDVFAEDLVDSVLWYNKDPMMGLDPDKIDIEEEMNMDSFDFREEQNIEIDEGGKFMGA